MRLNKFRIILFIQAEIQDPRFLQGMEFWIHYTPPSRQSFLNHFDSGWDSRSKIPWQDSWAILDLESRIPARIKMIQARFASLGGLVGVGGWWW